MFETTIRIPSTIQNRNTLGFELPLILTVSLVFLGCNILIGTPGRIKDFLGRGKLSFEKLKFLVLDEADRLLDMGFSEPLKEIVR